ncbi:MAG: tetratricopeptide repeat protein [Acidobacteriota bacterium]
MSCGQTPKPENKIPIGTASDEAREEFLKGRALFEKLLAQNSLKHFDDAVNKDPDFAMAYYYRGLASPSAKEFFDNLKQAVALVDHASEGERLWILGFEAGVNADPTKRGEYYLQLVQAYPEDERAHTTLTSHYNAIQEYESAIAEYKKATELAPDFSTAYNSLGYALRAVERYDEAEEFKSSERQTSSHPTYCLSWLLPTKGRAIQSRPEDLARKAPTTTRFPPCVMRR